MAHQNTLLRLQIVSLVLLAMIGSYAYVVVFGSVAYNDPVAIQLLAIIAGTLLGVIYSLIKYRRAHPI